MRNGDGANETEKIIKSECDKNKRNTHDVVGENSEREDEFLKANDVDGDVE